jgi:hypothetical protein
MLTDLLVGTYNDLDLTLLGRQEDWESHPAAATAHFWRPVHVSALAPRGQAEGY